MDNIVSSNEMITIYRKLLKRQSQNTVVTKFADGRYTHNRDLEKLWYNSEKL